MTINAPVQAPRFARPAYWVTAATFVAVLSTVLIAFPPRELPKSETRVRNASKIALRDVVVGITHYGDIAPGGSTGYQTWGPAYRHPSVEFEAGGVRLRHFPIDHSVKDILGRGAFTFVLNVSAPRSEYDFSVTVVED